MARDTTALIQAVESSLCPVVRVAGEDLRWSLAERLSHYSIPGASVAVLKDGRIDWVKCYGVLEDGRDMSVRPDSLFQAASMSKVVAAFLVMRMTEAGVVDLDEDINAYLRSWKVPDSELTRDNPVTLRKILSHRAGLTVSGFVGYHVDADLPTTVQVLNGVPPANSAPVVVDIPPGSQQRYSGGGTTIAQLVLEDATGKSFGGLAREYVLEPIGMTQSAFAQPLPRSLQDNAARGHRSDRTVLDGRWHVFAELAAAGLWTTPSDYARLFLEIRKAHRGESAILGRSYAQQMLSQQADGFFALGPVVKGTGGGLRFEHGGANQGYRCETTLFLDSGNGVVVMTNGDLGTNFCYELFNAVATVYGWPDFPAPPQTPIQLSREMTAVFAGEYRPRSGFDPAARFRVWQDGEKLFGQLDGLPAQELVPKSASTFFSRENPYEIRFQVAADTEEIGFVVLEDGREIIKGTRVAAAGTGNRPQAKRNV